jgi:hypothetical protein
MKPLECRSNDGSELSHEGARGCFTSKYKLNATYADTSNSVHSLSYYSY